MAPGEAAMKHKHKRREMKSRSMLAALLVAVVGVLVIAGCGSSSGSSSSSGSTGSTTGSEGSSGGGGPKLAAVFENTSDPFWGTVMCGAEAEASKLGAELDVYTSATIDTNATSSNVDTALLQNPEGVLLSPFDGSQFAAKTATLMKEGVPVVTEIPFTPESQYQTIFSSQNGGPFAEDFAKEVGDEGSIAVLGGESGNTLMEARVNPLVEAVEKADPDVEVLPVEYSDFEPNKATQIVSSLLVAHPDLKMVLASSGPEGQGAAAAIKQAGDVGKVKLFAFDAVPAEVAALKEGVIQGLVAQPAAKIGGAQVRKLVEYIEEHPEGGPVKPLGEIEELPLKLITKANVEEPATQPYLYKEGC
jgi:ribose transport system substrate-binding protein